MSCSWHRHLMQPHCCWTQISIPHQLLLWQTYQTNVRSGDSCLLLPRACLSPWHLPPNCNYPCGGTSMLALQACQFTLAQPTRLPQGGYHLLPMGVMFQRYTRPRGQTPILFHRPMKNHRISPWQLLRNSNTASIPNAMTKSTPPHYCHTHWS